LIDDETVARLLPAAEVLSAIEGAFIDPPVAPQRLAAECDDGDGQTRTLLAMPSLRRGGMAVVKVVTVIRGRAGGLSSHLLAFGPGGDLLAVIEAHQLTARRTAAASVLAARTLDAGKARRLAVLGAGRQARAQVEAYAAAMPIETITIWARRPEAAEELAQYSRRTGCSVGVASSPEEAVRDADIITCATASETPLVLGDWVGPGTHVDLVGGFRPAMREADDALMARATIVADTKAALAEAGDLVLPIASGVIDRDEVLLLSDLLSGKLPVRRGDITVFKSVGHAAEDLVIAELLLERLGLFQRPAPAPAGTSFVTPGGNADHD
jgi:ornithine cyclodeaminase